MDHVVYGRYKRAMDYALLEVGQYLQENSPKGISPPENSLRGGWDIKPSRKIRNLMRYEGFIINQTPNAINRLHGRGPGKFPPFAKGTPLAKWADSKGIPPFLVARKIAREGTKRWKEEGQSSFVGINPNSKIGRQIAVLFKRSFAIELARLTP